MNVLSPHKWWSTLKSAVFGSSSALPPLVSEGGGLVCESIGTLICCRIILTASSPGSLLICRSLAIHFLVLPPLPSGRERLGTSCQTWTLMVALTHWVCFLFFLRELLMFGSQSQCSVTAACSSWQFPGLLETGQCNPNSERSSSVANYRPIFITSVLSKVFERLVSVRLGRFMERSGVLPTTQVAYRKGLGTCDALLCVSHALQSALESGQEARIVQIDFSEAFEILIPEILIPLFSNFLKNSIIHFRLFLYLKTCFLRVTISLLCRSPSV